MGVAMETSDNVTEFVLSTLSTAFNFERSELSLNTQLLDIGIDSMSMTALVAHIEAEYGCEFSADQILELFRVTDIQGLIAKVSAVTRPAA
jgi:acyl carrier protein